MKDGFAFGQELPASSQGVEHHPSPLQLITGKTARLPTIYERVPIQNVAQSKIGEDKAIFDIKSWGDCESEMLLALRALDWSWVKIRGKFFLEWPTISIKYKFKRLVEEHPRLRARFEEMRAMTYSERLKIASHATSQMTSLQITQSRMQTRSQRWKNLVQQGDDRGFIGELDVERLKRGDCVWEIPESPGSSVNWTAPFDDSDLDPTYEEEMGTLEEVDDEYIEAISSDEDKQTLKAMDKGKKAASQPPRSKEYKKTGSPGEEEGR